MAEGRIWRREPPCSSGAANLKPVHEGGGAADGGWPLHPFLFAAAPVLSLYASNLRETNLGDMTSAMAAALCLALVLFLGFGVALRRFGARAAVLASVVVLVALHYTDLAVRLGGLAGVAWPEEVALPWALLAMAAGLAAVWLAPFSMVLPNTILNGFAIVFLAIPLWQIGVHSWDGRSARVPVSTPDLPSAGATSPDVPPDIYYIIFDRYASQSTLASEYGFDNSPLIDLLRSRGFYVADDSYSNYLKTAPSLASSLSMDYINFLSEKKEDYGIAWQPMYGMLGEHRVGRFLKGEGYTYIQIGAWWRVTQHNPFADENYSFGFSEFDWQFARKTPLPQLLAALVPDSSMARQLAWEYGQCQRVPRQIEQIKASGGRAEPVFVFAHILLPHEPYLFDADGRCLSLAEAAARDPEAGYLAQLRYANLLVADLVAGLLDRPGKKPVIVLQADEGPFPERYRGGALSWHEAEPAELRMKSGILNAYYFPDGDYAALYAGITPVNSFRTILNKYFGTGLEHLPDRIYASPDVFRIYDFFDVTDLVHGGAH